MEQTENVGLRIRKSFLHVRMKTVHGELLEQQIDREIKTLQKLNGRGAVLSGHGPQLTGHTPAA